jgi:hypothetical protein
MANPQFKARALMAFDLLGLAACLVVLVGASSLSGAKHAEMLPNTTSPTVVALDLFEAHRLAINSGKPVEIRFETNATGKATGYRILKPAEHLGFYELPIARTFIAPVQVSGAAIQFNPNGSADHDLTIRFGASDSNSDCDNEIRIETSGSVRLLES